MFRVVDGGNHLLPNGKVWHRLPGAPLRNRVKGWSQEGHFNSGHRPVSYFLMSDWTYAMDSSSDITPFLFLSAARNALLSLTLSLILEPVPKLIFKYASRLLLVVVLSTFSKNV